MCRQAGFKADGAALSSYQLSVGAGRPAMDLSRLVAKEVQRPAMTPAPAPQLTYTVQWQAEKSLAGAGDRHAGAHRARHSVVWDVTSGKQR